MGCCNGRTGGAELTPAQELPEEEIVIHQQENDNPFSDKSAQALTNEFLLQGKSGTLTFTQLELACRNIGVQVDLLTSSESQYTSFSNELRDDDGNFITKKLYLSALLLGHGSLTEKIKLLSKYFEIDEGELITEINAKKLIEDLIEVAVVVSPHLAEGDGKLTEGEIKRFSQELCKNKSSLVKRLTAKIMGLEEQINSKQFLDNFYKSEDLQQLLTTAGIRSMLRDENVKVISVRDEVKNSFDFSKAKRSLQEPYTTKGNPELEEEKIIENTTLDTNRTNKTSSEISLSARSSQFKVESEIVEEKSSGKHEKKSSLKDKDNFQSSKIETNRKEESSSLNKDMESSEQKDEDYQQTTTSHSLKEADKNKISLKKHHHKGQDKIERDKEFKIINDTYRNLGEKSPRTESQNTEKSLTDIKIVDLKLSPILDNYEEEEEEESSNDIKIDYNRKIDSKAKHSVSLEIKTPLNIESQSSDIAFKSSDITNEKRKDEHESIEKKETNYNKDLGEQYISGLSSESDLKQIQSSYNEFNSTNIENEEIKSDIKSIKKEKNASSHYIADQNIFGFDSESHLKNEDLKDSEEEQKRSIQSFSGEQKSSEFDSQIDQKMNDIEIIEEIKITDNKSIKKTQNTFNSDLEIEIKSIDLENLGTQIQNTLEPKSESKEIDFQYIDEKKNLSTETIEKQSTSSKNNFKNIDGEEIIVGQVAIDSYNHYTPELNIEQKDKKINSEYGDQNISVTNYEKNDIKNLNAGITVLSLDSSNPQLISPHNLEAKQSNAEYTEKAEKINKEVFITENDPKFTMDSELNAPSTAYEEEKNIIINRNIKGVDEEKIPSDKSVLSLGPEKINAKSFNEEQKDVSKATHPAQNPSALKIFNEVQKDVSEAAHAAQNPFALNLDVASKEKKIKIEVIDEAINEIEFNEDLDSIRDEVKNLEKDKNIDSDKVLEIENTLISDISITDSRRNETQNIEDPGKIIAKNANEGSKLSSEYVEQIQNVSDSSSIEPSKNDFKINEEAKTDKCEETHFSVQSHSEPRSSFNSIIEIENIEATKNDQIEQIYAQINDPKLNLDTELKRSDSKDIEEEKKQTINEIIIQTSSAFDSDVDQKRNIIFNAEEEKKDSNVQVNADNIEKLKTSTNEIEKINDGLKTSTIEELKTNTIEEVKPKIIEENRPSNTEKAKNNDIGDVKTNDIEEVIIRTIEEAKTTAIEEVKPNNIEEGKNSSSKEAKTSTIEVSKTSTIEEVKPNDSEEGKDRSSEEVKSRTIDVSSTSKIEEIETSVKEEGKSSTTEELQPSTIAKLKTNTISEAKTSDIEGAKTSSIEETKDNNIEEANANINEVEIKASTIEDTNTGINEVDKVSIPEEDKTSTIEELKTNIIEEVKHRSIEGDRAIEEVQIRTIDEIKTSTIDEAKTITKEGKTSISEESNTSTIEVKTSTANEDKAHTAEEAKTSPIVELKINAVEDIKTNIIRDIKATSIEEAKISITDEDKTITIDKLKTNATEEYTTSNAEELKWSASDDAKTSINEDIKINTIEDGKISSIQETKTSSIEESKTKATEDMKIVTIQDSNRIINTSDIDPNNIQNEVKNIEENEKSDVAGSINKNISQLDAITSLNDFKIDEEEKEKAKISFERQSVREANPGIEGSIKNIEKEDKTIIEEVAGVQHGKSDEFIFKSLEEKANIKEISTPEIIENISELNLRNIDQHNSKNTEQEEVIKTRGQSIDQNASEFNSRIGFEMKNTLNQDKEENKRIGDENSNQMHLNPSLESKQENLKPTNEEEKISATKPEHNLYTKTLTENKVEDLGEENQEIAVKIRAETSAISIDSDIKNFKEGSIINSSNTNLEKEIDIKNLNEKSEVANINGEKELNKVSSNEILEQPETSIYDSKLKNEEVPQIERFEKVEPKVLTQSSYEEFKEDLQQIEKNLQSDASINSPNKIAPNNSTESYETNQILTKPALLVQPTESESKINQENSPSADKVFAQDHNISEAHESSSISIESPKISTNFQADMTNIAKIEGSPSRGSIGTDEDKERVSLFPYQYLSLTKSEENASELLEPSISQAPKNIQEIPKPEPSKKLEKEKKPVVIQMNLGPGKIEKFEVHPGDDPVQMAYDFANSHQFTPRERLKLVKTMTELKAKLNY